MLFIDGKDGLYRFLNNSNISVHFPDDLLWAVRSVRPHPGRGPPSLLYWLHAFLGEGHFHSAQGASTTHGEEGGGKDRNNSRSLRKERICYGYLRKAWPRTRTFVVCCCCFMLLLLLLLVVNLVREPINKSNSQSQWSHHPLFLPFVSRWIVLGYASTLRHGLIPNLLDRGTNARFNCRDATWWWMHCVLSYIEEAPGGQQEGALILRDKVSRLFPTDEQDPPARPGEHEQVRRKLFV